MDWEKLKTEYITTKISYRKLAAKHNVSFDTLKTHAVNEGWYKQKQQYNNKVTTKTLQKAEKQAIDYKSSLYDLAYKVASQLTTVVNEHSLEELIAIGIKPKDITGAIKDLEDALHVKSERDIKEQEARIKNLQKQAEQEETTNSVTIQIAGGDSSWQG